MNNIQIPSVVMLLTGLEMHAGNAPIQYCAIVYQELETPTS